MIQGGIIKAYGDEKLYKVQAVTVIPPLKRVSSNEKRRQSKQTSSSLDSEKSFTRILEDACEKEKEQQRSIHIYNSGYTKEALPFYFTVSKREYS
ncbi:MAG: hypothetical protein HDR23_06555 [Lachnospiraceae bacterium]|nr:hypothetical protein [Lachnospiraceae bacterium]MBD5456118.1 hypothetical protein [Lachnospiraceae bacterium]